MRTLELRYPSCEALQGDYEKSLSKGRAFVSGAPALEPREACELALFHPTTGASMVLRAEGVWSSGDGVGLALIDFDAAKKAELEKFVIAPKNGGVTHDSESPHAPRNVHERVKALTPRQREDLARRGAHPERVALERAFGGAVWEPLLQNPQITAVEVAKIAKNGTIPKPLVNIIVNNAAWLASGEVQRALLSNPRCTERALERVLSAMPHHELARLAHNCPYRQEVRGAVQRLAKK